MNALYRIFHTYKVTIGIIGLAVLTYALFGQGGLVPSGASLFDSLFTAGLNVFLSLIHI